MPCSIALRAAFSAVICAAYGVLLREPFQPDAPADDHAITFPVTSVSDTIVLLNDALMCAWPRGTTRLSRLRRMRSGFGLSSPCFASPAAGGLPLSARTLVGARSGVAVFS